MIAQIPSADLFRWIGYFNAICGVFLLLLLFALFHGEYRADYKNVIKSLRMPKFSCSRPKSENFAYTRVIVSKYNI